MTQISSVIIRKFMIAIIQILFFKPLSLPHHSIFSFEVFYYNSNLLLFIQAHFSGFELCGEL
jgi:hypothetical protein